MYTVTAISRLTRMRDEVTLPCDFDHASGILERMKKTRPSRRSYIYPRLERYSQQYNINFKKN